MSESFEDMVAAGAWLIMNDPEEFERVYCAPMREFLNSPWPSNE